MKYHAHNPLQIDVLVVDETSMIDLPMMANWCKRWKPETRLILLGDQAQLASVEAGSGIREIAQFLTQDYSPAQADYIHATTGYTVPTSDEHSPLRDAICHFNLLVVVSEMIRALNNLLSKFNKEKARAVWQPLRNIHKSYISIILMKSKRLKNLFAKW